MTQSVASEEIQRLINVKEMLRQSRDEQPSDFSLLPWKVFPALGINDLQVVFSKSQIEESYEKHKHNGYFLWAEKLEKPEKGCILLNHWSQKAILLSEYDVERGARGYELRSSSGVVDSFIWPPLALEHELTEKVPTPCLLPIDQPSQSNLPFIARPYPYPHIPLFVYLSSY